jgi:hypothetical protein
MRAEMQAGLEAAAAAAAVAVAPMIPGPGFPPDKPFVPPFVPPPMIPGPGFPFVPEPFVPGPKIPGPGFPPSSGGGGGFGMDPGQRGFGTTVIINAAAVTAPEVIDLMGKYVQANGPLSRQWIGQ